MSIADDFKTTVEISAPLIALYLDSYVKPLISGKIAESRRKNYSLDYLSEYYNRTHHRFYFMRTIAFGDSSCPLNVLYEPLELVHVSQQDTYGYIIDGFPTELVSSHRRIVIRDSAGMGKSTLTRYMFLECLKLNTYIPIYVELRKIRDGESLTEFIRRELGDGDTAISIQLFNDLIRTDNALFFFDGYDEIRNDLKEAVTDSIIDFSSRFRSSRIILTSRDDSSLPAFGGYKSFYIQNLDYEKACALIRRYGEASGKDIHEDIIEQLNQNKDNGFRSLLENPLMVSLLFKAYDYKHKIPLSKSAFYNQVYDALFEGHDLSKEGYERERKTGLDKYSFEDILKIIAFRSIKEGPSYDRSDLSILIADAIKSEVHLNFTPSDFILDVLRAIPLMIEDGHEIRWAHKSFQEYFCARYIYTCSDTRKQSILSSMFTGNKSVYYMNVIEMCLDMDRSSTIKIVVRPFIKMFYENYLVTKSAYAWLDNEELAIRSTLTLKSAYSFRSYKLSSKDDSDSPANILRSLTGDSENIINEIQFVGSERVQRPDTIVCKFILSQQVWILDTISRIELFKGIDDLFITFERRDSSDILFSETVDIIIPTQSRDDNILDSKYYKHLNSLMTVLISHIGLNNGRVFLNPEKCPNIISAIDESIASEPSPFEDDFS